MLAHFGAFTINICVAVNHQYPRNIATESILMPASLIRCKHVYYFLFVGISLSPALTNKLTAPMPVQAAHCAGVNGTV